MNHQDLANQLNDFSFQLINHHSNINDKVISIQDEIFLRRVIFSRYYYALYHKYLAHDRTLSMSTGAGKHEVILNKIKNCGDPKFYSIFSKLRELRVWADYNLDDTSSNALNVNLNRLSQDVYSIIKKANINC